MNKVYCTRRPIQIFFFKSRSPLLRMRNVSDKCNRENQNTHFVFNKGFPKNRAVYEIMRKNYVHPGRSQIPVWRMRTACRIPKATNTHSEYVVLITLPLRQWLHERVSLLRYTCIIFLFFLLPTQKNFGIGLLKFWANMLPENTGELKSTTCFV